MAPEVFKHRKYDKKVDVFSFAMILYEVVFYSLKSWKKFDIRVNFSTNYTQNLLKMLEGEPPLASYEPYEAAKYVAEGHRPTFRAKGYSPELKE